MTFTVDLDAVLAYSKLLLGLGVFAALYATGALYRRTTRPFDAIGTAVTRGWGLVYRAATSGTTGAVFLAGVFPLWWWVYDYCVGRLPRMPVDRVTLDDANSVVLIGFSAVFTCAFGLTGLALVVDGWFAIKSDR